MPFGTHLINAPLPDNDKDDTLNETEIIPPQESIQSISTSTTSKTLAEVEITITSKETKIIYSPINLNITINGKEVLKAHTLANFNKYCKFMSSTDHLKLVQQQVQYAPKGISPPMDSESVTQENEQLVLAISDPVTSLLCSDNWIWLCIGEVNGLCVNVGHSILCESITTVSYQLVGLWLATTNKDPGSKNNWRSYSMEEHSFTVPG